ncbi:hypothetical protein A2164_03200 [Candidatus Curtissbacteria bacterium RBG_13_35_7]|uniref:Uncharacterized protein n=1 Tax=Candidatus Curtissbacteria bacterium RBG_13_35_7 TaxID=1797705 RepID=A0A1F5G1T3_9BACT|nr:MAG: hypothetical protein A2164_03200 [Candidatus Curtissbacteria bacterium RBG_13_35_7]
MYQKGIISTLVIILIFATIIFAIKTYYSKLPSASSQKVISQIERYPNGTNWQINNDKKFCQYYINRCLEAPAELIFKSENKWADIYNYYKNKQRDKDWKTESHITTSIPTSIIFTSNTYIENMNCQILVKQKKDNLLGLLEDKNTQTFIISSFCLPD